MSEISAITFSDCFEAALELFGKAWPAVVIIILGLAAWIVWRMLLELWHATVGRFLDDEHYCDDSQIDEQCGHDWSPQTHIQDSIKHD